MNDQLPTSLIRFGAELEDAMRRELGASQRSGMRSPRHRRRQPGFITAGAGLIAVAAVVLALLLLGATTNPPAAYALTQNADGTVTVTLRDLATAAPALNARFARLGIDETVIPITASCKNRETAFVSASASLHESLTLTAGRKYLLSGWQGVLAAKQLPGGRVGLIFGAAKLPLPSCFSYRATPTTGRVLGYRHPASSDGQAASARSARQHDIDRETLLIAKQAVTAFRSSHARTQSAP